MLFLSAFFNQIILQLVPKFSWEAFAAANPLFKTFHSVLVSCADTSAGVGALRLFSSPSPYSSSQGVPPPPPPPSPSPPSPSPQEPPPLTH